MFALAWGVPMSALAQDTLLTTHASVPVHLASRDVEELLALAKDRAPDASIFAEHPPVFYDALVSQKVIDCYSTMMMRSTLKNYAADAGAPPSGVAFQDSHTYNGMQKTLGRSVEGRFLQGRGDNVDRTIVTFFTQPTLTPLMQEFVDRMRSGLAADVSVGFLGGRTVCSICGGEMFGWWYGRESDNMCWHYPGVEYAVKDEDGKKTGERQIAIGQIEDAHLSEVSTVFDGATPGAGIIGMKARAALERGFLPDEVRSVLEQRYQIEIASGTRLFLPVPATVATTRESNITIARAVAGLSTDREDSMPTEDKAKTFTQDEIDRAIATARAEVTAPLRDAIRATGIEMNGDEDLALPIARLAEKIRTLTPQAKDGERYRDDLIEQTLNEGVRAYGDKFDKDAERAEMRLISIDGIKRRLALLEPLADDIFKGGRATEDGDGPIVSPNATPTAITGRRRRNVRAYGG